MLRKTLLIACLLGASGSALALDEFVGRHGIRVEPRVSISFGSGHPHYGYRDTRYHDVYVPHHVQPVYYSSYYYRGEGGHHYNRGRHHGWQNRDHHDRWRGYDRHDDDRRGHRGHHDDD